MATDAELLNRYCLDRSEAAFSALVSRHVNLAYSAAKRVVGSPDLAKEATQTVFLELAATATRLRAGTDLASWIYVAARRRAIDIVRREERRMKNERAAAEHQQRQGTGEKADCWDLVRPYLDAALGRLSDGERSAVIRRFFQSQELDEIAKELGISEDAAQKRVSRALEHLRLILARRGVVTAATALGAAVTTHAVVPAPSGLGAAVGARAYHTAGKSVSQFRVPRIAGRLALPCAAVASLAILVHTNHLRSVQDRELAETRSQDRAVLSAIGDKQATGFGAAAHRSAATNVPQDSVHQEAEILSQRIARLHDWMRRVTEDAAPEMALLTDTDWIVEVGNSPALDDYDSQPIAQMNAIRSSLGRLDGVASRRLESEIADAAKRYLSLTGQTPANIAALVPYFKNAVDPSFLTGFTLTRTGDGSKPQLTLAYWRVGSGWSGPLDVGQ